VAHVVDLAHDHPVWLDDAVIYGAIPFFFGPHGLPDITARLDAIAALGVTVLWLSPITDSPDSDFGYAVTDHFHLRASFGSAADLRALVQAAHARKLRVILDVAVNHLSDRHPYFVDAAQRGHASPYYDFFARDAAGKATHYFDWANLENLNYHNAEVRAYVIEAFARWVREFDVDGFRVDASWGIKERAPDFWPQWRAELKRIKPDLLLVAEASARDTYYGRSGFDAAYDWSDQLGQWAWHDAFDASVPTPRLRSALTANRDSSAAVLRFLDNNDTGARFVTRHGPAYTRVAATMLLTLPGLPVIYMGDEVGADFLPYGERRPLDWSDPLGLRAYYARLTALRHAEPGLRSNALTLLDTSPADGVLAYLRPGSSAAQTILVMLNFGGESARVQLPHTEEIAAMLGDDGRLIDLITGEPMVLDRTLPSVSLSPLSARVLRRAAEE
jgi:glycosidase